MLVPSQKKEKKSNGGAGAIGRQGHTVTVVGRRSTVAAGGARTCDLIGVRKTVHIYSCFVLDEK